MWVGQMFSDEEKIIHLPPKTFRIWKYHFSFREMIFIGVIILVVAILIIVSSALSSKTLKDNTCQAIACLTQTAYIYNNMDTSISPCNDFYAFSCGNFGKQVRLKSPDSEKDILKYLEDKNMDLIQAILNSPIPSIEDTVNSVEKKLKAFLRSCMDDYQHQKTGAEPLLKAIDEYGGCELLDTWNADKYSLVNLLQLDKTKYWTSALFDIRLKYSRQKDEIFTISQGQLGMAPIAYSAKAENQAYKEFIRDAVRLVIRDHPTATKDKEEAIKDFISDIYKFETEIAQIMGSTMDIAVEITVKDLQVETDKILGGIGLHWENFFKLIFMKNTFPETTILRIKKEYILAVFHLLNSTPPKTIQNFFLWRLMLTYIDDLTWEYSHTFRLYTEKTYESTTFSGLWNYCFKLLKRNFPDILSYVVARDSNEFHDQTTVQVTEMYNLVYQNFRRNIDNIYWMDDQTKAAAKMKLDTVDSVFGNVNRPRDVSILDEAYEKLQISSKDYFQNRISLNDFWRSKPENELEELGFAQAYETNAFYSNQFNTLFFTASTLKPPLYDKDLPVYMNYGAMGYYLFKELFRVIDATGRFYNNSQPVENWWSCKTSNQYEENIRNCSLTNYFQDDIEIEYNDTVQIFPVQVTYDLTDTISDVVGVQQAFKFYKEMEKKKGKEPLLKGLPKVITSTDQAFFLAFGQTLCYTATDFQIWQNAMNKLYPNRHRLLNAIIQVPEFSQAFQCNKDSLVNKFQRCSIVS